MPFEKTHLLKFFSSRVLGQSRSPAIPVFQRVRGASTMAVTVGFELMPPGLSPVCGGMLACVCADLKVSAMY